MKKVNLALVLAGLFISGVMLFLLFQGVSLKERRMVKWSALESPALAGPQLAKFMFPLMKDIGHVVFTGDPGFLESFLPTFTEAALRDNPKVRIESLASRTPPPKVFWVEVLPIPQVAIDQCEQGDKRACLARRALYRFNKKERDHQAWWINMYRTGESEAVLFFKPPAL